MNIDILNQVTYTNTTENNNKIIYAYFNGYYEKVYIDLNTVYTKKNETECGVKCNCHGSLGIAGESGIASVDQDINLDGQQTKLLKSVVEFLNQVSTQLYFSDNKFLSNAAKGLASQISNKFYIG